jgi:Multicopper oxidase
MNRILILIRFLAVVVVAGLFSAGNAVAVIPGITGPTFDLTAKSTHISNPDGSTIYTWGYADTSVGGADVMQYPGPTMILEEGVEVTISFTNTLPVPSSIVFPGQTGVVIGGTTSPGVITPDVAPGDTATYTFTPNNPGTYQYHSGTRPDLQVQMGMIGAIIVRPAGFDPLAPTAYGADTDSEYDHEYMFLLTEMDDSIHQTADLINTYIILGYPLSFDLIDTTVFNPVYWSINGRSLPDTMLGHGDPFLPNQPYGSVVLGTPGDKLLVRFIGGGVDGHPLHTHGDNLLVIARDGMPLKTSTGVGADLSFSLNTTNPLPGSTMDGIFQWTGKGMGWDIYGDPLDPDFAHGDCHLAGDPANTTDLVNNDTGAAGSDGFHDITWEWCADHGKPLPVALPSLLDMTFGGFWSGSPFLGHEAALPPGEGGLNVAGGFVFPWHSHHEKEVINFDVFPGGMFTGFILVPNGTPIP